MKHWKYNHVYKVRLDYIGENLRKLSLNKNLHRLISMCYFSKTFEHIYLLIRPFIHPSIHSINSFINSFFVHYLIHLFIYLVYTTRQSRLINEWGDI